MTLGTLHFDNATSPCGISASCDAHPPSIQCYNEHMCSSPSLVSFYANAVATHGGLFHLEIYAAMPAIVRRMLDRSRFCLVSCCFTPLLGPQLASLAADQAAVFSAVGTCRPSSVLQGVAPSPSPFLPFFFGLSSFCCVGSFHCIPIRCHHTCFSSLFPSAVNQLLDKDPGVSLDWPLFPQNRQWEKNNKVVTALPLHRLCFQNL